MASRVLIVDDSEFMQIMLQDILMKPEFEIVGVARNGIDAIEKYMELKPDLVTLDICMPHLNGLEVLDRIYKFDQAAKVVIVSSKGRTGDLEAEAISKGAKGVIAKPFKPSHALNTIREVLQKGFTLLEVLIATTILTIGVVGVMWAFSAGIFAVSDVEDVDLALNIAQAKMEEIKNTSFASLADSGPTADPNFPRFSVTVNVAEGQNPMQVDATVAWEAKGGTAGFTLTTLAADYATV